MRTAVVLFFVLWAFPLTKVEANYQLFGCFVDKAQRAIPYSGKTFSGASAIPQCAAIAASQGNRAFGVQYGGECFTDPQAHETYDKYGKSRDSDCKNGLGGTWRNNIYFLGRYRLIGCFVDRQQRAIPYSGNTFSGSSAIPKCYAIAISQGNSAFGVQYGGECFTGPQAHKTYDKYGKSSDSDCKNGLGGTWRNNVYFIGSPPLPPTAGPPGACGVRPSSRIVGGVAAKHGDWPWQAMLRTTSGFPYCGGTLVSPQWVVTATHCVRGKNPASITIRLGAHKRTSQVGTEQDLQVTKVITHSSYHQPLSYSHDIALLKLDRPAVLNRYVSLACLPDSVAAPSEGTKCWITGWGRLSSGGATPDILQQVSVPIVSRVRCDKAYPGKIHDSMICAGQDQGGIDSCQGDSGGPMVCESGSRYFLQGVTSWGYGCAAPGKFGVYAKVKFLMNFLNSEMANN